MKQFYTTFGNYCNLTETLEQNEPFHFDKNADYNTTAKYKKDSTSHHYHKSDNSVFRPKEKYTDFDDLFNKLFTKFTQKDLTELIDFFIKNPNDDDCKREFLNQDSYYTSTDRIEQLFSEKINLIIKNDKNNINKPLYLFKDLSTLQLFISGSISSLLFGIFPAILLKKKTNFSRTKRLLNICLFFMGNYLGYQIIKNHDQKKFLAQFPNVGKREIGRFKNIHTTNKK